MYQPWPLAIAISLAILGPVSHAAEAPATQQRLVAFDLPAGSLANTLNTIARQSGRVISLDPALVQGKLAPAVRGELSAQQALQRALAGSGLVVFVSDSGTLSVRPVSQDGMALEMAPVMVGATRSGDLPEAYAGGQVARGGRLGLLGNTDVMDAPFNITSYTAKAMEDQQAYSVMSVIRNDPAVHSSMPVGGLGEYFYMRGFYTQSHELAWDGLYGLVPHNRTPSEFMERVEVLKGPGALLYGMSLGGAVGGTVNLVPKRAEDVPLTRLTTSYVSDANLGGHLDVGRRFGQDNAFGIRVNALRAHGDLSIDGQEENRTLGSVALDFRGERVRASADFYSIKEQQRGGVPLLTSFASADIPKAPDPTINPLPGAYINSRSKAAIGSLEVDFNDQWLGYLKAGIKEQDGSGYLTNAFGANAQASGDFTARSFVVNNYFDVRSTETGVRGSFSTGGIGHSLVASANLIVQESGAVASLITWPSNLYRPGTPVLAAKPNSYKTAETTLSSLALADTLSFAEDRYLLTLGVRQQRVETKGFDSSGAETSHYDEKALTPAAGLVLKPWSIPVSLYANYIEGLSEGGQVTDASASDYGKVFSPIKSKQVEAGVKWDMGELLTTLSVFQIEKPTVIKDSASNTYGQDGEQRNRGIEWTFAGKVAKDVRLQGGAMYLRPIMLKTLNGQYDDNDAIGVPRRSGTLGVEWDLPWLPGLTLTGRGTYAGNQYADSANTQELPSWTRVDLGMRYATKLAGHATVWRADVMNAFDERYWEGVYNTTGAATVGVPRIYRLSMQIDF